MSLKLFSLNSTSEPKRKVSKGQEKLKKSVQDLIPIKDIEKGFLITPDLKMVLILKVSALNMELASNYEQNEIFETHESFLLSAADYNFMTSNVSMPVDLKGYIAGQEIILKNTTHPIKKKLLNGYIRHAKETELSQDILQRQRYLISFIQMNEDTNQNRQETMLQLYERQKEIAGLLSDNDLTVEQTTNLEIIRYFHTLFDYSQAQNRPIVSDNIPQIIIGGTA